MISFTSLPLVWQTLFMSLLFTVLTGEIALSIYKLTRSTPLKMYFISTILLIINFVMIIILSQSRLNMYKTTSKSHIPLIFVAMLVLISIIHLILAFPKEHKRSKACLSPSAIYETMNDLPTGICFSNVNGRIILCNNKMRSLANQLIGGYPQVIEELTASIKSPPERIILLPDGSLKFENSCIYHFHLTELTVGGQKGWKQLMAQDITKQYHINEQLDLENEKLKKTNTKLQKMYDRMADDIREKESLELKVYIHDIIGRSLLTIKDIMQSNSETAKKLDSLREAVGVLSSNRSSFKGTIDEVKRTAAKMGINVKIKGYIPAGTKIESLTVLAARECVTNCFRHAKGNEITLDIEMLGEIYKVTITNNGEKPKEKITEGSGLSSLRRSVEAGGGEMYVSHYPSFALIINLPVKESYDD